MWEALTSAREALGVRAGTFQHGDVRRSVFSMCMRESCRIAMWPPVCSMGKPHSVLTISPFTTYSVYLYRSGCMGEWVYA